MNQSIEVPADDDGVLRLIAFADDIEQTQALSLDQSYVLRLVIEEIATNIVKYGYDADQAGVIQLRCSCDDAVLRMVIRDHGQPFDPRESGEPDMSGDVANRQLGGLGLFLVRELVDELSYQHDSISGWNELVVVKAERGDNV